MPFDVDQTKVAIWAAFQTAVDAKTLKDAGWTCDPIIIGDEVKKIFEAEGKKYPPDILIRCQTHNTKTDKTSRHQFPIDLTSTSKSVQDWVDKLEYYFDDSTIKNYLIIDVSKRLILQNQPRGGRRTVTTFIRSGELKLSPPGLSIPLTKIFGS